MLSTRAIRINTDGPLFPAKTPGRDLKNRTENDNALATTVRRKGKNVLFQKTPAQSKPFLKGQKIVLDTATRPLGDKTPLPNRLATLILQSPSEKVKVSKPSITALQDAQIDDADVDVFASMKRPSSLRKHLKLPTNSVQKDFETPMNSGRHWDISDEDIDLSGLQPAIQDMKIVEDDVHSDEIEYCAPNTLDLPYQLPFDFELPNYAEVGKKIRDLAFSFPFDDAPGPSEPEFPVNELEPAVWEFFAFPPLESEDPFSLARMGSNLSKTSASKSSQNGDLHSHRRVQSSLAQVASASSAVTDCHKLPSTKTAIASRKQPNVAIQMKNTAVALPQGFATQRGSVRPPTRPHTSMSLVSKNKGTTLPPKTNDSWILDLQVVDEDFMFDVLPV